jgi:hypothetical protein
MGMCGGFIAAECDWLDLAGALDDLGGPLVDEGPVTHAQWPRMPTGDSVLHAASQDGRCYLLDSRMAASSDSDLIVELSRRLSCAVVGGGAATVTGTSWFTAARMGRLRRVHHDEKVSLTEPFSIGEPLGSERITPFDDPDGIGVLGGAHAAGFDVDVLMHGPASGGRRVRWPTAEFPARGELGRKQDEHWRTHQRPDSAGWEKHIKVIPRSSGQFDVRAW